MRSEYYDLGDGSDWQFGLRIAPAVPARMLSADDVDVVRMIENALRDTQLFRLDPARLASPSPSPDAIPRLQEDGTGLAEVIAHLMTAEPDRFGDLSAAVHAVIPEITRIRAFREPTTSHVTQLVRFEERMVPLEETREEMAYVVSVDTKLAAGIRASNLSSGTLITLGVLTALWSSNRLRLLLLDDVEHSLHPRAQARLIQELRKVQALDPELQIIATSHSPYILDELAPEEVTVTGISADGQVHAMGLSQHPRAALVKDALTNGELWSAQAEDTWVRDSGGPETPRGADEP